MALWAALIVVIPLVGCTVNTEEGTKVTPTLEQAKQEVWQTEDELVSRVPAAAVTKRWPRVETSSVLFECEEPGRYYWPGAVQLQIDPLTDSGAILRAIHDEWSARQGWKATWMSEGADGYHLDLLREDGLHVAAMNLEGNTVLQFNSFSPCFELADYDPNKSY